MTTEVIQEAPCHEGNLNYQDLLRLIPQHEITSLFRRHDLNREVVIGLVGLRGEGKSGTGAVIALVDFMFELMPCWSNMAIRCNLEIDDVAARNYGLPYGGTVSYSSDPLDKKAMLKFDPRFKKGLYFIDEINMEFADVRRAMSNTNLFFDRIIQQLRKAESSLIYTVIHEMWVDTRLRDLTDIFIKCEDTALSIDGLAQKKQTGLDFKLQIYPMTGYLRGRENSYRVTHHPLEPVYIHFGRFRGIYDDKQLQAYGKSKYGIDLSQFGEEEEALKGNLETFTSSRVLDVRSKWGWLYEAIQHLHDQGVTTIRSDTLWEYLRLKDRGVNSMQVGHQLAAMGISRRFVGGSITEYTIDTFDLNNIPEEKKEVVLL